jgi:hypothetical protein
MPAPKRIVAASTGRSDESSVRPPEAGGRTGGRSRPASRGGTREQARGEPERRRGEEERGIAEVGDEHLAERGPEAVRRHAGDAEDREALDPPAGRNDVGGIGEIRGEERAADDHVDDRERPEERTRSVHEEKRRKRQRVQQRRPDEHTAASQPVEQQADRGPHEDADREAHAEEQPDQELVAAQVEHVEREEHEHGVAHRAREVDDPGRPEGAGVEGVGRGHGVVVCGAAATLGVGRPSVNPRARAVGDRLCAR